MIVFEEARHLVQVKGIVDSSNWLFSFEGKKVSLKGVTPEQVAKVLQKAKAKDAASSPRSYRNKTYLEIANGIANGSDKLFWVWSNDIPTFINELKSLGGIQ